MGQSANKSSPGKRLLALSPQHFHVGLGHIPWRCTLSTSSAITVPENQSIKTADAPEQPSPKRRSLPRWWWIGLVVLAAVAILTFVPGVISPLQDPHAEVHRPGLLDFFPEAIIWEGTHFEINRLTLARFVAGGVLMLIFALVAMNLKLRPGRTQVVTEMLVDFVRNNIGIELLGTRRGKRYATILGFTFFGVLAMNLTGIIPGINIAASSVMSVPLVFAVVSYVTFVVAGIKARGGVQFFKEQLFPPGIPWPVYFLLTPIELLSTFIVRPATLAIRLLSNMISGHMLLALTYFGTQSLLLGVLALKPLAALTFAAAIVVTLFEIFVAVLQAYVFTILTSVYIKMSVESH